MVTFPPPPARARPPTSAATSSVRHGIGTYTASRPSVRKAALYIAGESEWETGSPRTAKTRVLPLITGALRRKARGRAGRELGELRVGLAVLVQVAAERVGDFGVSAGPAGELTEQVDAPCAAKIGDARGVVSRHGED